MAGPPTTALKSPLPMGDRRPCLIQSYMLQRVPAKLHLILSNGFSRVHECDRRHIDSPRVWHNIQTETQTDDAIVVTMWNRLQCTYSSAALCTEFKPLLRIFMFYPWLFIGIATVNNHFKNSRIPELPKSNRLFLVSCPTQAFRENPSVTFSII